MQNDTIEYNQKEVSGLVLKVEDCFSFFKEELNRGITEEARRLSLGNLSSYIRSLIVELGGEKDLKEREAELSYIIQERNQQISKLKSLKSDELSNENIGLLLEKNKNSIVLFFEDLGFNCFDIVFSVDWKHNASFECKLCFDTEAEHKEYDKIVLSSGTQILDNDKNRNVLKNLLKSKSGFVKEIQTLTYDGNNYFLRSCKISVPIGDLNV